jgi:hypothetical protein
MRLFKLLVCLLCAVLAWPAHGADKQTAKASPAAKQKQKPATGEKPGAGDKSPQPGEKKAKEKGEEETADEKPAPRLSLPLPTGQDSKGVTIPYMDGRSCKKTMTFRIGVARKLDETRVKMSDLLIEMLDENGDAEMTIDLPSAFLDLNTRIITGDQRVTIKRDDFTLTGQAMEFSGETRRGRINGDVKMIIYDMESQTGRAAEQPKPEEP